MGFSLISPQSAYALTSDEEWVMVVQGESEFVHFAIARRDVILMQGIFSLEEGQTLSGRIEQASRELQSGRLHLAFHDLARAQGVRIRNSRSCDGKCPWACGASAFEAAVAKYGQKVPTALRARGYRVFQSWETPII